MIACITLLAALLAPGDAIVLRAAAPNTTTVPRYARLELTLDLAATYDNPFDPDAIDVFAEFISPTGKSFHADGFLNHSFTRRLDGNTERIEPTGNSTWQIRFTPDAPGTWRYIVRAKDHTGTAALPEATFEVAPSDAHGFIRRCGPDSPYFMFENGQPFFAVGENLCWPGSRGLADYDDWLPALGKAGANWIRLWMMPWNGAIEWQREPEADARADAYHGLGRYHLGHAWKIDAIMDAAARNGINVMLTFGTFGEFTVGGYFNEGIWKSNPYNAENGGPCAKAEDFWTNAEARKLYQRRLRYIIARYAAYPNLFAWEFWNEANAPAAWIEEMARFVKSADPYRHLVSTTYGNDAVWRLPEIDFTMTHHYGEGNIPDSTPIIHGDAVRHRAFGKPHLMAEFGIDWHTSDDQYDPEGRGVNLHNGLWAAALSGNAGGAMLWYWDGYVHPKNLYPQFAALRKFADRISWQTGDWKPIDMTAARIPGDPAKYEDLVIAPLSGWERCPYDDFTIRPDTGAGTAVLPGFLFAPVKADLRTVPKFRVQFERPGRFEMFITSVSTNIRLRVTLDGTVANDIALSAQPVKPEEKPEYESTQFRPEYGIYQARFNKPYGIDVPAGEHIITVEATEGDWAAIEHYTFTGYTSNRFPKVHLYGLSNGTQAAFWIHNADHHWQNVRDKKPVAAIENARTEIRGLPPGPCQITWWDTWKGEIVTQQIVDQLNGALPIAIPPFTSDIAAQVAPAS